MPDPFRDPFGRLLVGPASLPWLERIDSLRRAAGRLQASSDPELAYVGRCVATGLRDGGSFSSAFGIEPEPGTRRTAQSVLRSDRVTVLLRKLAVAAGSRRRAARIAQGREACPASCRALVDELREVGAPASERAFDRAHRPTSWTR